MESPGLLALTDELLHQILLPAGAPAVARAATLCRRLRSAQAHLAALPAFASAASIGDEDFEESVSTAVLDARERMVAAVDICLLFVGGWTGRGVELKPGLVQRCQELLPPGTLVVGCCGRGLFGQEGPGGSLPAELDPSQRRSRGASVLLGRLPGCILRAFTAADSPDGSWAGEEACREWLGLGAVAASGGPAVPGAHLRPLSCLLFAHASVGGSLNGCVEGLQAAFPSMLLTGGIASGLGHLFCSQPLLPAPQPVSGEAEPGGEAGGSGGTEQTAGQRVAAQLQKGTFLQSIPRYVGLLVCQQQQPDRAAGAGSGGNDGGIGGSGSGDVSSSSGGGSKFWGAALSAQGMQGGEPLLARLQVLRNLGVLQQPNGNGQQPHEVELLGLLGACSADGRDAMPVLTGLAERQAELGLWAADGKDLGSFDAAVSAGRPVAVLQLYGFVDGAEAMGAANDAAALAEVLAAAGREGCTLCAQPLRLSPEGAKDSLAAGVASLVAARPPAHALLPTTTCGLIVVSCTAKGRQMHGEVGVEAAAIHASSGQLTMAGVYCDGEIGPEIFNAKSTLRWVGSGAAAQVPALAATTGSEGGSSNGGEGGGLGGSSKVQGFTTVVAALAAGL